MANPAMRGKVELSKRQGMNSGKDHQMMIIADLALWNQRVPHAKKKFLSSFDTDKPVPQITRCRPIKKGANSRKGRHGWWKLDVSSKSTKSTESTESSESSESSRTKVILRKGKRP